MVLKHKRMLVWILSIYVVVNWGFLVLYKAQERPEFFWASWLLSLPLSVVFLTFVYAIDGLLATFVDTPDVRDRLGVLIFALIAPAQAIAMYLAFRRRSRQRHQPGADWETTRQTRR
jgi:uncharacterized membrane-anchored protein